MNARTANIVAWVLQALLAAAFVMAGGTKLLGDEMAIGLFEQIGWGQWFRYATGLIEVGGAILLLVPGFVPVGALALAATMIGAIVTHVFVGGTAIPASVLFLLCCAVLWLRRDQAETLRAKLA